MNAGARVCHWYEGSPLLAQCYPIYWDCCWDASLNDVFWWLEARQHYVLDYLHVHLGFFDVPYELQSFL